MVYAFTTYSAIFDDQYREGQPNRLKLMRHLREAFLTGCPDRDKSPSGMDRLLIETREGKVENSLHEYCAIAAFADYEGKGNQQHEIVQSCFHLRCADCIATEVPVWDGEMAGCIDVVLYGPANDKVILLDFKPNAHKEQKAATQLFYYKKLLVQQTGIDNMECYYFDDTHCYKVLI